MPLEPLGREALVQHRKRQHEAKLLTGDRWQKWDLVFTTTIGTPFEPSYVGYRLRQPLSEAGLPRQRVHAFRHCAASLILAGQGSARDFMEILGRSPISLSMNTYTHFSPEMKRHAVKALESALTGGT